MPLDVRARSPSREGHGSWKTSLCPGRMDQDRKPQALSRLIDGIVMLLPHQDVEQRHIYRNHIRQVADTTDFRCRRLGIMSGDDHCELVAIIDRDELIEKIFVEGRRKGCGFVCGGNSRKLARLNR